MLIGQQFADHYVMQNRYYVRKYEEMNRNF